MPYDPLEQADIRLHTLAQLSHAGSWQLDLPHERGEHLLVWITRGQGVALLDGARRGIGTHNALFIPARHLMAIDLGSQGFGQALILPPGTRLTLPQSVQHLRIRDVAAQNEMTSLLEALSREQSGQRPLCQSAILAFAELAAIWLRRQMTEAALPLPRETAARRLSRDYCEQLAAQNGPSPPAGISPGADMARHAAALGVTPTHLTRVCRAETGKTAATLLTERQLHAARQLLIATDAPVQDIARHLGFGSAAYFTRFVQHHTGQAPTALRRAAANRASAAVPR